jgi:DNA-binding XRE family transcriptional regulator
VDFASFCITGIFTGKDCHVGQVPHFPLFTEQFRIANVKSERRRRQQMSAAKNKHPNSLVHYRRRMGFTQEQVAQLLGHKSRNVLSDVEQGYSLPSLETALKLGIVYRVPVDFLYHDKYIALRNEIREREGKGLAPRQGVLALSTL